METTCSDDGKSKIIRTSSTSFARRCRELTVMPKPYSAVSSKSDLAHAGP